MFGTAFGSFLEPKDSFDSQACWTIHQRREGQTFVESSHFVLRKKKTTTTTAGRRGGCERIPKALQFYSWHLWWGHPGKTQSTNQHWWSWQFECWTVSPWGMAATLPQGFIEDAAKDSVRKRPQRIVWDAWGLTGPTNRYTWSAFIEVGAYIDAMSEAHECPAPAA